jgi:tetratricopeptide (TPR) repeat protein
VALANAGRTREAVIEDERALRLAPGDAGLEYNLGSQLAKLGDWEQAGRHFSEAVKTNPNDEKLQNNFGLVLVQQGRLADALTHFQAAIQLAPGYSKPYFNSALVLQKLGQTGAAVTNYSEALELDPDWLQALNGLSMLLATTPDVRWRNPPLALKLAGHADEITSHESALCLDALAVAYAANGAMTNAVAAEEQALDTAKAEAIPELVARLAGHLAGAFVGQASSCSVEIIVKPDVRESLESTTPPHPGLLPRWGRRRRGPKCSVPNLFYKAARRLSPFS